jgi:YbgC/YbaW family acyl-CoA thioester hydrolase
MDDIEPPGAAAFQTPVQVRFRDVDSMGHVNNAVYASYLEQARADFFADVVGERLHEVPTVLVTQRVDYRRPIEWGDDVTVALVVDDIGRSSLPMRYAVRTGEAVAAVASTVQVVVNESGDSAPVPDAWRERIATRHERVDNPTLIEHSGDRWGMSSTPTEVLIDHALSVEYDAIAPETRDRLRRHVLDTIGIVVGAREVAASSESVLDGCARLAGDGGEATTAAGDRRPATDAALLNGTLAHSLDFDDTHRESSLHPGAPVIPAALAVAEREGVDATRFLEAVHAGYDITCAVGRAVNPDAHYERGFHVTATCGTFGAAVAAGVAAGLDREELLNAMGIAGSQAAGSLQFLANGAWNKRLHPGLAAQRGVEAATLAAAGFEGAADPLAGTDGFLKGYSGDATPDAVRDVGERTAVTETALKPYPCCRYMHAALDALVDIAETYGPGEVKRMVIDLPEPGVRLTGDPIARKRRPENFVDCQFSMPFGAALAIDRGAADLTAFLDAQDDLDDPALRALMDATEVTATDAVAGLFPEQWAARVVVETDTEQIERTVGTARGEPEDPLDWSATEAKFANLLDAAEVSDDTSGRLADAVRGLGAETTLDDLTDALRAAGTASPPAAD